MGLPFQAKRCIHRHTWLATALSWPEPIAFATWVLLDKDYQVLFHYNGVLTPAQLNKLMKIIDEINK
ncbi:hypothetical protein ACFSPU_01145 [Haoranjiania flava]|uniref:Uncharacterized protein n=1 Tax=Haoranjiania flava TaxID=1856322 RepID=A0AAE3IP48_9BACT|nr:hypothetical protein [Haoranjiania flava]MCU7693901.1 hypothetical protein [Haoranjiania flava]